MFQVQRFTYQLDVLKEKYKLNQSSWCKNSVTSSSVYAKSTAFFTKADIWIFNWINACSSSLLKS